VLNKLTYLLSYFTYSRMVIKQKQIIITSCSLLIITILVRSILVLYLASLWFDYSFLMTFRTIS